MTMSPTPLPLPGFFDPRQVGSVWRVPYQQRVSEAAAWANQQGLTPAHRDRVRTGLLLIDCQNTFCTPGFELYLGDAAGAGPVADNERLCTFIYRHLGRLTEIVATLDTHQAMQIFHGIFLLDAQSQPPPPYTAVSVADVVAGRWRANPAAAVSLGQTPDQLQAHLLHYCQQLAAGGKYQLMIWPYHALLGGIGHALVSAVEEAIFFHGQARQCWNRLESKGTQPLVESYSVLRPEVQTDAAGRSLATRDRTLLDHLLTFDVLLVAGQAKSHCVAWTLDDLLTEIQARDPRLAEKVWLLEDCTSPVVVAGAVDFREQAAAAFARFAQAGMRRVTTTELREGW